MRRLKNTGLPRRAFGRLALGTALVAALSSPGVAREQATLQAIFLPATWGVVVRDVLAPQYEEETGVKVEVQLVARDAIHDKMATLFAARDPSFDIFNLDYSWIPEFAGGGHLASLEDLLSEEDHADFFETALEVGSWNDTIYGIPQTIHPHILWYRSDLYNDPEIKAAYMEETGSELTPPETMNEWLQQMKFFHGMEHEGATIYGWAGQAARGFGNVHTWLSFLYSYGAEPLSEDFSKSTLSTPEAIAATAQWAEMMKYMPPGANDFTYDNVTTSAQQGTVATALQWSWGAFAVDDPSSSQTVGDWDFVEVPSVEEAGESAPHLAAWVISVSNYSENQEEAKKFIAWLETKENDVLQASLGGGDPVRRSSYENPTLTEETLDGSEVKRFRRYDVVLEAMENTRPRPRFPGEEAWETAVSGSLQAIQLGEMSVEEGLAEADSSVDRLLSR